MPFPHSSDYSANKWIWNVCQCGWHGNRVAGFVAYLYVLPFCWKKNKRQSTQAFTQQPLREVYFLYFILFYVIYLFHKRAKDKENLFFEWPYWRVSRKCGKNWILNSWVSLKQKCKHFSIMALVLFYGNTQRKCSHHTHSLTQKYCFSSAGANWGVSSNGTFAIFWLQLPEFRLCGLAPWAKTTSISLSTLVGYSVWSLKTEQAASIGESLNVIFLHQILQLLMCHIHVLCLEDNPKSKPVNGF